MSDTRRGDEPTSATHAETYDTFYPRAVPVCQAVLRRRYADMRLALLSASDLEDAMHSAVQDALAQAHRRWDTCDPARASRLTWVVCMAKRRFSRLLARAWQRALRHVPQALEHVQAGGPDETRHVVNGQTAVGLFAHLAPRQAEALRLHYLEDLPLRQVAEHMRGHPGRRAIVAGARPGKGTPAVDRGRSF